MTALRRRVVPLFFAIIQGSHDDDPSPHPHHTPKRRLALLPLSTLSLALLLALPAAAQTQTAQEPQAEPAETTQTPTQLDAVQVTGSRVRGRTAQETAAPFDIIGQEELANTGAMEVGQALQLLEPSLNFSRTTISDGTDILRPATLRALGPDQVGASSGMS